MTEINRMDRITDKLKERINRIGVRARGQFKGTNPYRMEKVSPEERIMNYQQLLDNPDIEQQLRTQVGNAPIDKMHLDMRELINRRQSNG